MGVLNAGDSAGMRLSAGGRIYRCSDPVNKNDLPDPLATSFRRVDPPSDYIWRATTKYFNDAAKKICIQRRAVRQPSRGAAPRTAAPPVPTVSPAAASASRIVLVVWMTVSGLSEMELMPRSTRKLANSG
jgi:hypothetical protein